VSAWIERPSPNYDSRREGCPIDILVLHYTGMRTAEEALERLCDPEAKVSAHYTIDRDGRVYRHVDESLRARHAGVSYWAGERDVNSRSIGIELVNPGHEFGYVPFPEVQIEALIELSRGILTRHLIPPQRVVGHSDVAPARKVDPGELFPWEQLAANGIGMVPPPLAGEVPSNAKRREAEGGSLTCTLPSAALSRATFPASGGGSDFAQMLARFGYGVPPEVDIPLATVVTAFQRHFRPEIIDGVVDAETESRLAALLEMLNEEQSP
jgi:N-acetylmuramoyl-L-alanine amidase